MMQMYKWYEQYRRTEYAWQWCWHKIRVRMVGTDRMPMLGKGDACRQGRCGHGGEVHAVHVGGGLQCMWEV